jgi:hypothetical protein
MRPFAGDLKDEAIDVGVKRPAAGGELAQRQAGFIMHTEDRRDPLQRPGANQVFAPPKFSSAGWNRIRTRPGSVASRSFSSSAAPSITLV